MKPIHQFLVSPKDDERYIEKEGGFLVGTSIEDHLATNRYAVIEQVPKSHNGDLEPGDVIIVHHNVFREFYDMRGEKKTGKSFFRPGTYLIDDEQWYMSCKDGVWRAKEGFCFVRPIPKDDSFFMETSNTLQPLTGELAYESETTKEMGLKVGDIVSFIPDAEYPFNIEGEIVYRIYTDHLTMIHER